MRLVSLYQVYDRKAGTVMGPIWATPNEVPVARALREALADGDSILAKNPGDFDLVRLGEQDTDTGIIAALDRPKLVFLLRSLTGEQDTTEQTHLNVST